MLLYAIESPVAGQVSWSTAVLVGLKCQPLSSKLLAEVPAGKHLDAKSVSPVEQLHPSECSKSPWSGWTIRCSSGLSMIKESRPLDFNSSAGAVHGRFCVMTCFDAVGEPRLCPLTWRTEVEMASESDVVPLRVFMKRPAAVFAFCCGPVADRWGCPFVFKPEPLEDGRVGGVLSDGPDFILGKTRCNGTPDPNFFLSLSIFCLRMQPGDGVVDMWTVVDL